MTNLIRALALLVAAASVACQGMDRLEPDRTGDAAGAEERGTILGSTTGPAYGSGGQLTIDAYQRRLREIMSTRGEERLTLAARFLREYPQADVSSELHELVGDAHSELNEPAAAAEAWQRALELAWPPNDILGLPQANVELPYEIGWAHFEAGSAAIGAEWLTRATFISDRPQLQQGLQFVYAELGSPGGGFNAWFSAKRAGVAVPAPDFELPGYGFDSLRLTDIAARVVLINFWTPT